MHGKFAILTDMDITIEATKLLTMDDLLYELLRQVARGKETAFAELYVLTCHMVFGSVLRILREQTDTEDTVQEIYVQVWQKAKCFDESRGSVLTWLLTIARSRALDKLRFSRVRFGNSGGQELGRLESPEPNPEESSSALQRATLLRRAVNLLPPEQRRCVLMAFFQGLTHSEIANQTAIPLGTVKTRIRSGIMRLTQELGVLDRGSRFCH